MAESSSRRRFMKTMAATPILATGAFSERETTTATTTNAPVKLFGDGLSLSSAEYVEVLGKILEERGIEEDYYSRGGVVEELEQKMAAALGKERAVYFPTGTLANHVAVRILAGDRTRVIAPYDSHLYADSGDCVQTLSHLNLLPLSSESATFTLEQVRSVVERTESGRVTTGVGALLIESPVRRKLGEMFDYEELKKICAYAKEHGIGTHLDGARLYMASGYSGIAPREYASHFDTVYVSLWKYFNAGSGAILAGPARLLDELYHTRRMFGGGLPGAWQFAAVALHYFERFESDFQGAVATADALFSRLRKDAAFEVEPMPNGSNLFKLTVKGTDPERFRAALADQGVLLSAYSPERGGFLLGVNATLNRSDPETLARKFVAAL